MTPADEAEAIVRALAQRIDESGPRFSLCQECGSIAEDAARIVHSVKCLAGRAREWVRRADAEREGK